MPRVTGVAYDSSILNCPDTNQNPLVGHTTPEAPPFVSVASSFLMMLYVDIERVSHTIE